jgi:hypothetical protein
MGQQDVDIAREATPPQTSWVRSYWNAQLPCRADQGRLAIPCGSRTVSDLRHGRGRHRLGQRAGCCACRRCRRLTLAPRHAARDRGGAMCTAFGRGRCRLKMQGRSTNCSQRLGPVTDSSCQLSVPGCFPTDGPHFRSLNFSERKRLIKTWESGAAPMPSLSISFH